MTSRRPSRGDTSGPPPRPAGDDAGAPPRPVAAPVEETAWQGRVGPGHFVSLGLLSMFAPLSIDMYLPALPGMQHSLHTTASVAQLSITACLIGISAGPLLTGPLSDRFGRKRPVLVGITVYVVVSLLCAAAPSIGVLIALRFLQGVSGSAGIVISRAIVRDMRTGNAAARLFSMLMLVSGAAPAAAPVIGAQLLRLGSWRGVFVALAIFGSIIWCTTVFLLPETLPPDRRRAGGVRATLGGFRRLLCDPTFLGYGFATGFIQGAMFAYIAGSPFVLEDIFHLSPQEFSGVFAMNAVGLVVFAQVGAALVGRLGARALVRIGVTNVLVAAAALVAVVAVSGPLWAVIVCLFFVVADNNVVGPNAQAVALSEYPRLAGSAAALLSVLQFAIGGTVAPLVGLGGNHDAAPMAAVIFALALASSAVVVYLTIRQRYSTKGEVLAASSPR